jgi:hypothetical protein
VKIDLDHPVTDRVVTEQDHGCIEILRVTSDRDSMRRLKRKTCTPSFVVVLEKNAVGSYLYLFILDLERRRGLKDLYYGALEKPLRRLGGGKPYNS